MPLPPFLDRYIGGNSTTHYSVILDFHHGPGLIYRFPSSGAAVPANLKPSSSMGRLEQPPDKIATRCAQGLLTASQLKPRLGRNCSTFLLNSTEGMLRAQAGRQTHSFMRRVLLITLILNGTARASMNAETNIRGSQLARTPIETMPEELLADIGYGEVSTRRVTVLAGGSHRVKPEQKHVIIGKGRDRVGEDFDRGMKSTASIAFKR